MQTARRRTDRAALWKRTRSWETKKWERNCEQREHLQWKGAEMRMERGSPLLRNREEEEGLRENLFLPFRCAASQWAAAESRPPDGARGREHGAQADSS